MTAIAERPAPPVVRLPTDDDLPYSDGVPMESNWHVLQSYLLRHALEFHWRDRRRRYFIGTNMFLYFSEQKMLDREFRGPDFFVVLDVANRNRKSWVVWQEGKGPDVIVELLSETTADNDRKEKKRVYQDQVRVPEYFWYHPETREFAGFALVDGVYQPIPPDESGGLSSSRLGLKLVRWSGEYLGQEEEWVRWATPDGVLLPTPQEAFEGERLLVDEERQRAEEERQRADEERQRAHEERQRADEEARRAEEERQRAERLAERLRSLGIDPNE